MRKKTAYTEREREELDILINNIRYHILSKYSTVEKFCFENGFNKTTIYEIFNRNNIPNYLTIIKIKNALSINIVDLVIGPVHFEQTGVDSEVDELEAE